MAAWPLLLLLALSPCSASEPDWRRVSSEMREHLRALVRLDTSNPPGNEILAARYLQEQLRQDGIDSRLFVSTGTRASLIARLKGRGRRKALVLMCHTDVVPVERARWSVDPFAAVEKDGYVYGRGTADVKGLCAAELTVLAALKRAQVPLERDVVFFAEADEESGDAQRHIDWLMRRHGRELDSEFAINEGGNTLWEGGKVKAVRVQASEKQYVDVRMTARGGAGHASLPRPDNAVYALGRALARLSEHRPPVQLDPVVRGFLKESFLKEHPELRELVAALEGPGREEAALRLERLHPEVGAMLRDTINPTMLKAGIKSNVVPSEAEAVLNCRLLPGQDAGDFLRGLSRVVEDKTISFRLEAPAGPAIPAMPVDTDLFRAIASAVRADYPDAVVTPFMSAWSTDSQALRARGTIVYGFDPPLSAADAERTHGHDERISLAALDAYLKMLYRMVVETAGRTDAL